MKGNTKKTAATGFGQLTLVEHSLCPLDHNRSLVENLVHKTQYSYSDAKRKRQTAKASVFSPLGLSANDELYLWGLLALTLSQSDERSELVATPHWCLRQLGIIDAHSNRGGNQYQRFRDSLRRLSTVSYLCDAFYDPTRAEHRSVSFHFFSYSLPESTTSSRAWRISWDPTFFDLAKHGAGHLSFDLELYRQLDPASRRLFLFVSKIFHRRSTLPQMNLRRLAVEVLGFSSAVADRNLRVKANRCFRRLSQAGVFSSFDIQRVSQDNYVVRASRGKRLEQAKEASANRQTLQPVLETLVAIGFEPGAAYALIRRYPSRLLEEWADITQAAQERFGSKFFKKSPMAYLVDSVRKSHAGTRTPPDWWHDVRRAENRNSEQAEDSSKLLKDLSVELFGIDSKAAEPKSKSTVTSASDILKATF